MAKLQASSVFYQFPDLTPFQIQTFPRLEAQIRGSRKVHSLQQLNPSYVENLTAQWLLFTDLALLIYPFSGEILSNRSTRIGN